MREAELISAYRGDDIMEYREFLMPLPAKITDKDGCFNFSSAIVLNIVENFSEAEAKGRNITEFAANLLRNEIKSLLGTDMQCVVGAGQTDTISLAFSREAKKENSYSLNVKKNSITINAADKQGFIYAAATLLQMIKVKGGQLPCVEIADEPSFENRAYLLDISRGRIPGAASLERLADALAFSKINQLQLYVENSVAVGPLKKINATGSSLSAEEVKSYDKYCDDRGIELVPCIATFGHLYDLLRSEEYQDLCEMPPGTGEPFTWYHRMRHHTLNVSAEGAFQLVKELLDEFLPLFKSKKVNICCDETFDLGCGKSRKLVEEKGYAHVYCAYINRLAEYLKKQGYSVMIWSDIVLKYPAALELLNKDVSCLTWHYYYNASENQIRSIKEYGYTQYVCPSVSGYSRLINEYDMSFANLRQMAALGAKHNAVGYLNTDWGDTGHINMPACSIPGLCCGGAMGWNINDTRSNDELDRAVSILFLGDKSGRCAGILRKASRRDLVIFNELSFYRDYKKYNLQYTMSGINLYENALKAIFKYKPDELESAAAEAEEYAVQISALDIVEPLKNEYCLAIKGLACIQRYCIAIQEGAREVPEKLAADISLWLEEYVKCWHISSRTSELDRIVEFFKDLLAFSHLSD